MQTEQYSTQAFFNREKTLTNTLKRVKQPKQLTYQVRQSTDTIKCRLKSVLFFLQERQMNGKSNIIMEPSYLDSSFVEAGHGKYDFLSDVHIVIIQENVQVANDFGQYVTIHFTTGNKRIVFKNYLERKIVQIEYGTY